MSSTPSATTDKLKTDNAASSSSSSASSSATGSSPLLFQSSSATPTPSAFSANPSTKTNDDAPKELSERILAMENQVQNALVEDAKLMADYTAFYSHRKPTQMGTLLLSRDDLSDRVESRRQLLFKFAEIRGRLLTPQEDPYRMGHWCDDKTMKDKLVQRLQTEIYNQNQKGDKITNCMDDLIAHMRRFDQLLNENVQSTTRRLRDFDDNVDNDTRTRLSLQLAPLKAQIEDFQKRNNMQKQALEQQKAAFMALVPAPAAQAHPSSASSASSSSSFSKPGK